MLITSENISFLKFISNSGTVLIDSNTHVGTVKCTKEVLYERHVMLQVPC